jgi:hypothetical protein
MNQGQLASILRVNKGNSPQIAVTALKNVAKFMSDESASEIRLPEKNATEMQSAGTREGAPKPPAGVSPGGAGGPFELPPVPPFQVFGRFPEQKVKRFKEILGIIVIVAGIIVAAIIAVQSREMLQAASVVSGQLKPTQDQLEEIKRTRMDVQRARIAMDGTPNQIISEDKESVTFEISYKNTGRTPALKVTCATGAALLPSRVPHAENTPNPPVNAGNLAPNGTGVVRSPIIMAGTMKAVTDGVPLYLYGTIWYDDVFGKSHWSQFCWKIERLKDNHNLISFRFWTNHNSSDDIAANKANRDSTHR